MSFVTEEPAAPVKSARHVAARRKGASGEREALQALRDIMANVEDELRVEGHDIRAMSENVKRNTTQSDRGGADLYGLPLISVEVKRCETLQLDAWWDQCVRQAKNKELPVLIFRRSREKWRVRTWAQLTTPDGRAIAWTAAVISFPEFLSYWRTLYREFLLGIIRAEEPLR